MARTLTRHEKYIKNSSRRRILICFSSSFNDRRVAFDLTEQVGRDPRGDPPTRDGGRQSEHFADFLLHVFRIKTFKENQRETRTSKGKMQRASSSPRKSSKRTNSTNEIEVLFILDCPEAQVVYLCGSFNNWVADTLRMVRRHSDGCWECRLPLRPGRYEYKYLVDGKWIHDALSRQNVPNQFGTLNSVRIVQDSRPALEYNFALGKMEPAAVLSDSHARF
jgi:hypothetical protein